MNMESKSRARERTSRIKGVLGSSLATYGGMGLSLISTPLLAHSLGASGRGVLAAAFVGVQFLTWTGFLGIPGTAAILADGTLSRRVKPSLLMLGLANALLLFIASPFLTSTPHGQALLQIAALLMIPMGLADLGLQHTLAHRSMLRWNLMRSIPSYLPSTAIIIFWVLHRLDLETAFISMFAGQAVSVIVSLVAVRTTGASVQRSFPWRRSLHLWLGSLSDAIGSRVDQLALAAFSTSGDLGKYAVAYTVAVASGGVSQAAGQYAYRDAIATGDLDRRAIRRVSAVGIVCSLLVGSFATAAVAFLGPVLLGPSFSGLTPLTATLVLAQIATDQYQLRFAVDSVRGKPGRTSVISASSLTILLAAIGACEVAGVTSGLAIAFCVLGFGLARLCIRYFVVDRAAPATA